MTWFLVVVLVLVVVLALLAVIVVAVRATEDAEAAERARIEMEVIRAERRLHDVARDGFQAMLDAARRQQGQ